MICISHLFIFTTRKSRTLKCFLQYQKNSTIQKSNITLLYIVGRIYSCISGQITIHPSLIKNFLCFLAVIIHWGQKKFWFKLTTDFTYNSSTVKKMLHSLSIIMAFQEFSLSRRKEEFFL